MRMLLSVCVCVCVSVGPCLCDSLYDATPCVYIVIIHLLSARLAPDHLGRVMLLVEKLSPDAIKKVMAILWMIYHSIVGSCRYKLGMECFLHEWVLFYIVTLISTSLVWSICIVARFSEVIMYEYVYNICTICVQSI